MSQKGYKGIHMASTFEVPSMSRYQRTGDRIWIPEAKRIGFSISISETRFQQCLQTYTVLMTISTPRMHVFCQH
ncbi:hypothetical protein HanPSC8_Chr14g0612641 [Helianthus annuus]|nr:hypothetical protein HanPSC8_Chr14g0612641 [Helianthus annuus]